MHVVLASLLALIVISSAWAEEQELLSLEAAETLAVLENPGLAAQAANARALAQLPAQLGSLPDPTLSFKAMNLPVDSFSATQENMTQLQAGISQSIPFPGKLTLRQQAASLEAEAAGLDADEHRLILLRNVRIGWWNLFYLERALGIVRRNQELLRQFVRIAETKYKVGKGLQQDVLLAQLELSKLLDVEISLHAAARRETAALNALLNRPAHMPIRLPASVDESLPEAPAEQALAQTAQSARPLLHRYAKHIEAAETRVSLAEKDYYPDFKLGAAYGLRSGVNPVNGRNRPDFASVMFSLNLPIYSGSKQDRKMNQRKAELIRSEFSLADARATVLAEISRALADYDKARAQVSLFRQGIIPQANLTVASMLAGYQVGKVDFLSLVSSQVTLYNFETQYWQAIASANQALARLAAAVGKEIDNE
ncbi:MAG: TolC family protein [Mariprofundaceae bacterium]